MKLRRILLIVIIISLLAGIASRAQDNGEPVGTEGMGEGLTATEMVDIMMNYTRGESSYGVMTMNVVTPDWDRSVEMEWWERGEEMFLVRVLKPTRDEGNGTLKIGNNLWSYIYAFDETIHIPPAMMAQSWMGSDFTNDDMVRESSLVHDYEHELWGIEEIDGIRCYRILMTADPSTPVPWLKLEIWVRTEDLLPVRQEYYDDDDELARYMEYSEFVFMFDRITPTVMRMVPLDKEGHYTELIYRDMEFDIEIADDVFSEQNLTNP